MNSQNIECNVPNALPIYDNAAGLVPNDASYVPNERNQSLQVQRVLVIFSIVAVDLDDEGLR